MAGGEHDITATLAWAAPSLLGGNIPAMPANAFPAHTTYSRSVHIQTKGSQVMNTEGSTDSSTVARRDGIKRLHELPALRFDIDEAKEILRMSRAQLYIRIAEGAIAIQKDGARKYISLRELERYVEACEHRSQPAGKASSHAQGANNATSVSPLKGSGELVRRDEAMYARQLRR